MTVPAMPIEIVEYRDEYANDFYEITAHWMSTMYSLEPHDLELLRDPKSQIIDRGGVMLFARSPALGIVGTCSLTRHDADTYEVSKMGVREAARGLKAGEALMQAIIDRWRATGASTLFLLTHEKSAAAIRIYGKFGFVDDDGIRERFGHLNRRCNVWMRLAAH